MLLTQPILVTLSDLSNSLESRYDKQNDDWCGEATEKCAKFLSKKGISVIEYHSNLCCMGGCILDASHAYLVMKDCGTIIDPTITQFILSPLASKRQKRIASGFPTLFGVMDIAVIPVGHPFSKRMAYEAHTHGREFRYKPAWWPKGKRFYKPCSYCVTTTLDL